MHRYFPEHLLSRNSVVLCRFFFPPAQLHVCIANKCVIPKLALLMLQEQAAPVLAFARTIGAQS